MVSVETDLPQHGDQEEELQLSSETFSALAEFYREQEEQENRQAQVGEDWQLSQFWYSEATAGALAGAVLSAAGPAGRLACVSAPTLYTACRARTPACRLDLFEFDKRFAVHGSDFHFYDYKAPLQLDSELRGQFDLVFADPPFLSEECLTKTLVTVRWLARPGARLVLCTGAVMAELAARLAQLQPCRFTPEHEKSLSNPFQCFADFDFDQHVELGKQQCPPPPEI